MADVNPFRRGEGKSYPKPRRPIDTAMNEIRNLKFIIIELRKEIEPLKEDLLLRKQLDETRLII